MNTLFFYPCKTCKRNFFDVLKFAVCPFLILILLANQLKAQDFMGRRHFLVDPHPISSQFLIEDIQNALENEGEEREKELCNTVEEPDPTNEANQDSLRRINSEKYHPKLVKKGGSAWRPVGPLVNRNSGSPIQAISYISSIGICRDQPNIMYCNTQPGEIYKSVDRGENWENKTLNYDVTGNGRAIAVHPENPDEVISVHGKDIYKSSDGGGHWKKMAAISSGNTIKIYYNDEHHDTLYFCTTKQLYVSTDGGETVTESALKNVFKIALHPTQPHIIYATAKNPSLPVADFYRSTDYGFTWTQLGMGKGLYYTNDPNADLRSAIPATTKADPDRVYVAIYGNSKEGDNHFIGLYKSLDQGETWALTHDHVGGPYTSKTGTYPSMTGGRPGHTAQCELVVSNQNPDHLIIGVLQYFASHDGGKTFSWVSRGSHYIHVDPRDSYADDEGIWICNDGGITFTKDALQSHRQMKNFGIHSQDFWGFDVGWHEKVIVGSLYHNGVLGRLENYPEREYVYVEGGEPASACVNPHDPSVLYSWTTVAKLPDNVYGARTKLRNLPIKHNMRQQPALGDKFTFHPNNYNVFYCGNREQTNALWITEDNGRSFSKVHTFEQELGAWLYEIEIASSNPKVIYVTLAKERAAPSLYKTTDGGNSWEKLAPPTRAAGSYVISLDAENENNLWLAQNVGSSQAGLFTSIIDGQQVFQSTDGGKSWENRSSPILNGETGRDIISVAGTNGGVYLFTQNAVYYRDNTMSAWEIQNEGMPFFIHTKRANVWYKGGELLVGAFGRGVYETEIHTPMSAPVARVMVDKFKVTAIPTVSNCYEVADTFHFDDHSFLRYEDKAPNTWDWTFPTGQPSSSQERAPSVFFSTVGVHSAILTVTDVNGNQDTDTLEVRVLAPDGEMPDCLITSVTDGAPEVDFSVYPNPTRGIVHLSDIGDKVGELRVYNGYGERVFTFSGEQQNSQIDLSNYPDGIYFIEWKNAQVSRSVKVVLTKD